ncbi:MAG: hypothetical protein ABI791_02770 [Acidobacteriota bacterium]
MLQKLLLFILIISLCPFANAQVLEAKRDDKPEEKQAKLHTQAVAFLREAMADANNLHSLENRISFTSELAGLMWYADEKEAKSMFNGVINDFRGLLMQYDSQMNAIGMGPNDGDYNSGFMGDLSDKSRISRKFGTAMAVRQQIAMSLAEHDAETAFNFYYDTKSLVTNAEFRSTLDGRDMYFESKLVMMAVAGNSPKAVQFAAKSLDQGLNSQHVELLKKIAEKNPDQAADFGAAILSKIKSDKIDSEDYYAVNSLLSFGDQNLNDSRTNGKKSVYSQTDLRELADTFAQSLLDPANDAAMGGALFVSMIEKYAPGRAAQIRARGGRAGGNANTNTSRSYRRMANAAYAEAMAETSSNVTTGGGYASNSMSNSSRNIAREQREEAEAKSIQDVMSLGGKELPREDREKIVARARKLIAETPSREKKIMGLSALAAQVAAAGDKELAAEIMKEAASLVNTNPRNYQDFILNWMLASGYAAADPEKAFPLLEDTISRANDTIAAFVKVAEFIDISGEMIDDGEVQVGAFGGSMISGLTGELGMADSTVKLLVHADFEKTCALANRFDRPEVRMLAKMIVLRAVLGEKKPAETPEADDLN